MNQTTALREIHVSDVTKTVAELAIKTCYSLEDAIIEKIKAARENEVHPVAKNILTKLEENIEVSKEGIFPLCQDTGMACVFLEVGQDVHFIGGNIETAINEGVKKGYTEGFLRKSVVKDPLKRENTGDNTPAHIVYDIVPGDKVKITFAPKGFGSENMSRIKMLPPSAGVEGIIDFVIETVKLAGANPCPPIVVGIGIGGTFDKVALLAKKALLVPADQSNSDPYYRDLESQLLEKINNLGIGPQGFGGTTTALAVKIKAFPTHIAGLPVAVNINCHVSRHAEAVL